jgi:hypothetical protein
MMERLLTKGTKMANKKEINRLLKKLEANRLRMAVLEKELYEAINNTPTNKGA